MEENITEELDNKEDDMLDDNSDFHCRPKLGDLKLEEIKEEVIEKDSDAEDEKKKTEEQEFVELKSFEVPYRRLRRPQSVV